MSIQDFIMNIIDLEIKLGDKPSESLLDALDIFNKTDDDFIIG